MKFLFASIIFSMLGFAACGQKSEDRKFTFDEWQRESFENIRLLPRYGYASKSPQQLTADKEFIKSIQEQPGYINMRDESDKHIRFGFEYLYRGDLRTAMYRFNQAYLLDSTNTDDYWGYGAVYMQLHKLDLAEHQYRVGLSKDSLNHHLWTDLATVYSVRASDNNDTTALNTAIQYLQKSYKIQPKDANTTYKLSVSYYLIGNCSAAKNFLKECEALGGQPITPEYKIALAKDCNK